MCISCFSLPQERRKDRPEGIPPMEAFGLAEVIRSRFTVGLLISALNVLGMVSNMRQPNNLTTSMYVACTSSCGSSSVRVAKHRAALRNHCEGATGCQANGSA